LRTQSGGQERGRLGWSDRPDPVAALRSALGGRFSHELDEVVPLDRTHRLSAAERLELDLLQNEAPVAPFGNPAIPAFFSARVGCKTFQPLFSSTSPGFACAAEVKSPRDTRVNEDRGKAPQLTWSN
jgi:hypothetical protein